MKADDINFQSLMTASNHYLIPVFQRYYSWKKDNWDKLWNDIEELMEPDMLKRTHFMGSLVFFSLETMVKGPQNFLVIDGQQRLITFSLLLCAVRYIAHQNELRKLQEEIKERFLVHKFEEGTKYFRVYPRLRDRDQYTKAIKTPTIEIEGQVGEALKFFTKKVRALTDGNTETHLRTLFDLLQTRIEFVYIRLDEENPYQIFKSLNSTGVDLSEADLIRNFVFMNVDLEKQDTFDDNFWRPLETYFEDEQEVLDSTAISNFFRDFLMQDGDYVRLSGIFEDFEDRYMNTDFVPEKLAHELKYNAELYDIIHGNKPHSANQVTDSLKKLHELDSSTTYPLLLNLLHRNKKGNLSDKDLCQAINLITSFILRRFVCGDSSRTYGRWFVMSCRSLGEQPMQNLLNFLKDKGFPSDKQFRAAFSRFNRYESRYTRSILEALEHGYRHKEPADLSSASIEHIMPQTLTAEWRDHLGPEAERIHEEWLHTIGNLTLSAYNAELRNHEFSVKREEYKNSHITLNRKLAEFDKWDEAEIRRRGEELADLATQIWIEPIL